MTLARIAWIGSRSEHPPASTYTAPGHGHVTAQRYEKSFVNDENKTSWEQKTLPNNGKQPAKRCRKGLGNRIPAATELKTAHFFP